MKDSFPTIETSDIILRQFIVADLENVYKGLSHPDVIKYYGIRFDSLEAAKEQMDWYENLEKTDTGVWWVISSKENDKFYGAIGFNNLERKHNKAEIGFWLMPDF